MKARRYGIWAGLAIVAAITSGALLAQAPQAIGTWVSVGDLSSPLTNGASVALPDKRTLIAGGALADGTLTDAVTIYDSVDDSATAAGTLTSARADHTATLLKDGRVLVAGGMTADGLISSDIEIFDPATGTSAIVALLPEPRNGHVAAALPNGNVLIAGGATVDGAILQTAILFDPETSAVSSAPGQLHTARMHASATTMLDGRVLVAGGSNGTAELASAEIYDRYSQSFSIAATQMSVGRQGHSAVLLPDNGGVLVAGGTLNGVAQAGVDLFLPAVFPDPFSYGEGEFTSTGAMTAARARAVAGPTSIEGFAFAAAGGAPDAEVYRFATIKTDKDDYAPGEAAIITGSGWQPNEEVTLRFQEDPAVHDDYVLTVTADAVGNIHYDQWAPEEHDLNVRFYLMAQDSRSKAQTTFTDAKNTNTVVTNPANPSVFNQSVTFTATVTCNDSCAFTSDHTVTFRDGGNNCGQGTVLSSGNAVTLVNSTTATATFTTSTLSVGEHQIRACFVNAGDNSNPNAGASNGTFTQTVNRGTPTLSVSNSPVTYTGAQQSATVVGSVPGIISNIRYNGSPTVPTNAGTYAVTANFAPTATTNYDSLTSASAGNFVIEKATPTATLAVANSPQIYTGAPQAATVNITVSSVPGAVANISTGGASAQTNAGPYAVTADFVPTDSANYHSLIGLAAGNFVIEKATPTVTVQSVTVTFDGQAHGTTATVVGGGGADLGAATINYDTADGLAPVNAGSYVATGTFAGNDNYTTASGTAAIVIAKATPTVTVLPVSVTFNGLAHGTTGTVAGVNSADLGAATISYDTADGLAPVNAGSYVATGTFAGNDNYTTASGTAAIVIAKATPTVTVLPVSATFDGLAHGTTGTVAGVGGADLGAATISYDTADGLAPVNAGSYVATGTFAGNDNYTTASGTAAVAIAKATPTVTVLPVSATFNGLAHGTTGTVAGVNSADLGAATISYDTADGLAPVNAGSYVATGTFAGDDNYTTASGTAAIVIAKATPVITWATPADIVYGTPLSTTQLNATADVTGSFLYTPAAGATLNAGPNQTLSVIFTPTDAANYNGASKTVQITVLKATPVITWATPADIVYGTALSTTQLSATADVAGSFLYTPAAGVTLNAGANQQLSVAFTPTDAANYNGASKTVQITVLKATPVITWATPADIVYGTALSTTQLSATADVAGSFLYTPAAGVTLNAGANQQLSVAFTPTDAANYNGASKTVQITVLKATPVITWATPADIVYGTALSTTQLSATADVAGSFLYTPAAGVTLNAGANQQLSVAFTPTDAANYNGASKTVQITVLYQWDGFLQPINDTAHDFVVMSKFKAGQTIPAKFVLKNAAGAVVQQTPNPEFRFAKLGACNADATLEDPSVVQANVVPQYIWDGAQYHYNWSTKGLQAGLYRIFANLADGTARSVDICLTK